MDIISQLEKYLVVPLSNGEPREQILWRFTPEDFAKIQEATKNFVHVREETPDPRERKILGVRYEIGGTDESCLVAHTGSWTLELQDGSKKQRTRRYMSYCKAHGFENDPEGMLKADEENYPGGKMVGFILWVQARLNEFYDELGMVNGEWRQRSLALVPNGQDRFDDWLEEKVNAHK